MKPIQVAALEKFLVNNHFNYYGYDEEIGVVVYNLVLGDWAIEVAYGDECYYRIYNEITEEAECYELTNVSQVMTKYDKMSWLSQ